MLTKAFLFAVLERALKTFGQTAAALLVGTGVGLLEVDWLSVLSVAGMAALVSVLTSVGTGAVTDGNPSIGSPEVLAEPGATADPVGAEPVEVVNPADLDGDGHDDVTGRFVPKQ